MNIAEIQLKPDTGWLLVLTEFTPSANTQVEQGLTKEPISYYRDGDYSSYRIFAIRYLDFSMWTATESWVYYNQRKLK